MVGSQSLFSPSWRMILHAFCAMNSNDLLKNFPTKSWGKVFLQKNKKLRIGYLPFQKGFAANLCCSFASLSIGTVICVLETLNRGLPLELALPSSTISDWHRKLLSSRSSSSQFTRSLVRPSYWYRSSETQRCEGKTQIRGKSFLKGQVTDPRLLILL